MEDNLNGSCPKPLDIAINEQHLLSVYSSKVQNNMENKDKRWPVLKMTLMEGGSIYEY